AYVKAPQSFRLALVHLHAGDVRPARPALAVGDQLAHVGRAALQHDLHGAVWAVGRPPGRAQSLGLAADAVAEEHALHAAADGELAGKRVVGHGLASQPSQYRVEVGLAARRRSTA